MNKPHHPWIERFRSHMNASGSFELNTITDRCELLYRLDRELPLGLIEATIEELEHWLASGRTPATQGSPAGHGHGRAKSTYFKHISCLLSLRRRPQPHAAHVVRPVAQPQSAPGPRGRAPRPCSRRRADPDPHQRARHVPRLLPAQRVRRVPAHPNQQRQQGGRHGRAALRQGQGRQDDRHPDAPGDLGGGTRLPPRTDRDRPDSRSELGSHPRACVDLHEPGDRRVLGYRRRDAAEPSGTGTQRRC
jgi:hypothetical protein